MLLERLARVEGFYWALMRSASSEQADTEPSLGGRLMYAGALDATGCALATAGSVAGVASLAVTADEAAQKQAIRDGVVDFLVTSLDEALRILKNEIRKREPVAVCVATESQAIEREMRERGVQPDLLAEEGGSLRGAALLSHDTVRLAAAPVAAAEAWLAWGVEEAPARWMPQLDALALACMRAEEKVEQRWLRHAPRYMGRMARGVRVLRSTPQTVRVIASRMQDAVKDGSIGAPVWMTTRIGGECVEVQMMTDRTTGKSG